MLPLLLKGSRHQVLGHSSARTAAAAGESELMFAACIAQARNLAFQMS
jgi:hypothetical protein